MRRVKLTARMDRFNFRLKLPVKSRDASREETIDAGFSKAAKKSTCKFCSPKCVRNAKEQEGSSLTLDDRCPRLALGSGLGGEGV